MNKRKLSQSDDVNSAPKKMVDDDSEYISFNSVGSLEHLATVRIAIALWKHPDLRQDIGEYVAEYNSCEYRKSNLSSCVISGKESCRAQLCRKVRKKLTLLQLPGVLYEKISNLIEPIGQELLSWISSPYNDNSLNSLSIIETLRWTPEGIIDRPNTLLAHPQFIRKNRVKSFLHACQYCMEDLVLDLWKKLPDAIQEKLISECFQIESSSNFLLVYWTHFARNVTLPLTHSMFEVPQCQAEHSLHGKMVALAIRASNVFAVKYFVNTLVEIDDIGRLMEWIFNAVYKPISNGYLRNNTKSDIIFYLLSLMTDKIDQTSMIRFHSYWMLLYIAHSYPWNRLLMTVFFVVRSSLNEHHYACLMSVVAKEIVEGRSVEPELFQQLWCNSPDLFKKCYIKKIIIEGSKDLYMLFETKNDKIIKLIYGYLDDNEKGLVATSFLKINVKHKLIQLICDGKFEVIDFIVGQKFDGNVGTDIYKHQIETEFGKRLCDKWLRDNDFEAVQKFLGWRYDDEDEIEKFKVENIDEIKQFKYRFDNRDYESLNSFLQFYFRSEEEVKNYKRSFAYENYKKVICTLTLGDQYCFFLEFVRWCFDSEEESIMKFRQAISEQDLSNVILELIGCWRDFDLARRIVDWRFRSASKMKAFKLNFLSTRGYSIFKEFIDNYAIESPPYWKLMVEFANFFHPLHKDEVEIFQSKIIQELEGPNLLGPTFCSSLQVKKRAIVYILHNFMREPGNNAHNIGIDYQENSLQDETINKVVLGAHIILNTLCGIGNIHYDGIPSEGIDWCNCIDMNTEEDGD